MEITAQVTSLHIVSPDASLHSFDLKLLLAVTREIGTIRQTFTQSSQSICRAAPPIGHVSVLDYDQNSAHMQTSTGGQRGVFVQPSLLSSSDTDMSDITPKWQSRGVEYNGGIS